MEHDPLEREPGGDLRRIQPSDLLLGKQNTTGAPRLPPATESSLLAISSARTRAPKNWDLPPDICAGCSGAGYYKRAVPYGHADFGKLLRCECLTRGHILTAEEVAGILVTPGPIGTTVLDPATMRASYLESLVNELGLLAHCTFESFDLNRPLIEWVADGQISLATQRATLIDARARAESYAQVLHGGIFACGPVGGGKSHLAAAIAHTATMRGIQATYASMPKLLSFIKAGYANKTADERRTVFETTHLLILDDLEPVEPLGPDERILFEILNARYLAKLPMVVTSNWLLAYHPSRLASRIRGMTADIHQIELFVSDIRGLQRSPYVHA